MSNESWYVKGRGPEPLGPFEEERIVRGILAGKVPLDASVSGSEDGPWSTLLAVPVFARAVHRVLIQREEGTEVRLSADATQNVAAHREITAPARQAVRPTLARLFAVALLGSLLAAAVAALVLRQPTRTPDGVARQLLGLLAAGDVASLRARRDLGMSARVSGEVQARGRQELERRQKLLERAEQAGARKLLEIERKAIEAGEATYACLAPDEQRRIRDESRTRFILGRGVEALGDERAPSLSIESFLDFNQRAAAVNRLGERSLCADERQRLLTQPEDAESQRLARRRSMVGESELSRLQSRAWALGTEALQALPPEERSRINRRSLRAYLIEKGFPSLSEGERKLVSAPRILLEDDALAATTRRQLGLPSLAAEERADVEALPPEGDAPRLAFVEQQGTRLLADTLRHDMSAGGYTLASTVLHGRGPHALLRSFRASSTLQFDDEREVPARRWLPTTLRWHLVDGHYQAAPAPGRELLSLLREVEATAAAMGAGAGAGPGAGPGAPAAQPPASAPLVPAPGQPADASLFPAGAFFSRETPVAALMLAMLWGLLRRTSEPPATSGLASLSPDALRWGAVALALAALQQLFEGQVNLDDWAFLPLFLAFPCVVGARRGVASGTASGLLVGLALLVGTILFRLPDGHLAATMSPFPSGEFLLAGLVLGGLGAAAGHLASRPALVALLPLLWVPCSGLFERSHLASLPLYGQASLACAWAAVALGLSHRFSSTSNAAAAA